MARESHALSSVIPGTICLGESPAHRLGRSPSARETPVRFRRAVRMNRAIQAMTAERLNPLKASCGESSLLKESLRTRISAAKSGRSASLISQPIIRRRIETIRMTVRENAFSDPLFLKDLCMISPKDETSPPRSYPGDLRGRSFGSPGSLGAVLWRGCIEEGSIPKESHGTVRRILRQRTQMRWGCIGVLIALIAVTPVAARLFLRLYSRHWIYESLEEVPSRPVALVLGAGLRPDGSPTAVLADRVRAGAALYHLGKVERLLLSGDGRSSPNYNEPEAMRRLALRLGVLETALWVDPEGMRTLDSCWRAREVFGVTQVVVVSQRFHLDRAVWLCASAGLDAVGLAADRSRYGPRAIWWNLREIPASLNALIEGLRLRLDRMGNR